MPFIFCELIQPNTLPNPAHTYADRYLSPALAFMLTNCGLSGEFLRFSYQTYPQPQILHMLVSASTQPTWHDMTPVSSHSRCGSLAQTGMPNVLC